MPSNQVNANALAQGLDAFHRLREYRKLHELCWEPTEAIKRPYSEAEIEEERQKLEDRGGSKKESVYDIIRRRKRTMRVQMVQNQMANSIADLAAVLLEQEKRGAETEAKIAETRDEDRREEVKQMLKLAEEAKGGALKEHKERLAAMRKRLDDPNDALEDTSRGRLKREISTLSNRRRRMVFAARAVLDVQAMSPAEQRAKLTAKPSTQDTAPTKTGPNPFVFAKTGNVLDKRKSSYATHLRATARYAEKGGMALLESRLLDAKAALADNLGNFLEAEWRIQVRRWKVMRKEMDIAVEKLEAGIGSEESFVEVAKEVKRELCEWDVELAKRDVEKVVEKGRGEDVVEILREALAVSEERLEWLLRKRPKFEPREEVVEPTEEELEGLVFEPAVEEVVEEFATEAKSNADGTRTTTITPSDSTTTATPSTTTTLEQIEATALTPNRSTIPYHILLPSFPRPSNHTTAPQKGGRRAKTKHRLLRTPIFHTRGMKVKWHNPLDAEYAPAWPENVAHEPMGWTKYAAPRGNERAVEDVRRWREKGWLRTGFGTERDWEGMEEGLKEERESMAKKVAREKEGRATWAERFMGPALGRRLREGARRTSSLKGDEGKRVKVHV